MYLLGIIKGIIQLDQKDQCNFFFLSRSTILSTYVKIPIFFNQAWNLRILFPNFCSSSTTFFFFSMTDVILELAKNGMIHLQKCLAQNDKFIHVQIFLLLFFVIFIFIFFFFLLFSMTTQWVKNV